MMKYCFIIILFFLSQEIFTQNISSHTYSIQGKDTLKLDIYRPDNARPNDKLPVLLWIHGGGFSGGSRDNGAEVELCKFATTKGYVAVSISYRLLRKGKASGFGCECPKEEKMETFKQGVIDYLDASKFLIDNANRFNIDKDKIVAGGSSAGAEIILNTVFMREFFINDLSQYKDVKYAGLFSLAGATVDADYIDADNAVPSVLFHGTEDNLVPFATAPHHYCDKNKAGYLMLDGSATIVKKLQPMNVPYYFYMVENGKHELSSIPFEHLNDIFQFFQNTVLDSQIIQTKIIKNK